MPETPWHGLIFPNPEGIRKAVYKKFPELKKRHEEREGKSDE